MAFWMKNISLKKLAITSVIYTVISLIVNKIQEFIVFVPPETPPDASTIITKIVFTVVTGVSISLIYYYLRDHLPENKFKRTTYFTDLMMGTYFVFFTLPVYLMFNVPLGLLVSWFISGFIIILLNTYFLVKIIK